ncbi:15598_t:CDS:2 [Entrophospora sp. SA101]|nr:15598_t:CDS:2 [Entrophospora sp. SA101]
MRQVKEYYSLDLYPIDGENDGNEIDDKGDELLELNVFTDFTTIMPIQQKALTPAVRAILSKFMVKDYKWMLKIPELSDESNKFISKVEEMIKTGNKTQTYKYCLKEHMDSQSYSFYETLNSNDMLAKDYTECDIIIKTFSYLIKTLEMNQPINQKW